jgi:hypothetical protein
MKTNRSYEKKRKQERQAGRNRRKYGGPTRVIDWVHRVAVDDGIKSELLVYLSTHEKISPHAIRSATKNHTDETRH